MVELELDKERRAKGEADGLGESPGVDRPGEGGAVLQEGEGPEPAAGRRGEGGRGRADPSSKLKLPAVPLPLSSQPSLRGRTVVDQACKICHCGI